MQESQESFQKALLNKVQQQSEGKTGKCKKDTSTMQAKHSVPFRKCQRTMVPRQTKQINKNLNTVTSDYKNSWSLIVQTTERTSKDGIK